MKRAWLGGLLLLVTGCAGWRTGAPGAWQLSGLSPPPAPAWAMEGRGPERSSRSAFEVPADWELRRLVRLVKETRYEPEEYATPLVLDDVAFVGHSDRAFEAIRLRDGNRQWRVPTRGRVLTTAAYADGLLIFGDDQGELRAVTLDGREAWRFPVPYPIVAGPLVAEGRVYVAVADQNIFCLEAGTGLPLWQYGRGFPGRNALWRALSICYGGSKAYVGSSDGTVVALDGELGRVVWRAEIGAKEVFGDITAGPSLGDGRIYAGAFSGPTVCLDAETGEIIWRQELQLAAGFAVGDDFLYAATLKGTLVALARRDGQLAWETAPLGGIPTAPVLAGSTVVVGLPEGSLLGFDAVTGAEVRRYDPGPGLHGQPLVFEGGVVFLSDGGALHWVD